MLLNLLTKEEKYYFIDLLNKVVSVDGAVTDNETQIINRLKFEMGEDILKYHKSPLTTEKLIAYFAKKAPTTKNLVFLNIISSSLNDEFYSVEEHFLIAKIQEAFEITNKKKTDLMKIVYADRDLKENAKRVISE